MPEVIEVQTYARFLRSEFRGRWIRDIEILSGRYTKRPFPGYQSLLDHLPFRVRSVETKGKLTAFHCEDSKRVRFWILITLGMTGGWVSQSVAGGKIHWGLQSMSDVQESFVPERSEVYRESAWKNRRIRFVLKGDETQSLYFYDTRNFGTVRIFEDQEGFTKQWSRIGPDITTMTFLEFRDALKRYTHKEIGAVLLNQRVVSGIGNYLRSEILWCARVDPFKAVGGLTDRELRQVYKYARWIIGTEMGERTPFRRSRLYRLKEEQGRPFFVYRMREDPYGNPVRKATLAGRTIHYVPVE